MTVMLSKYKSSINYDVKQSMIITIEVQRDKLCTTRKIWKMNLILSCGVSKPYGMKHVWNPASKVARDYSWISTCMY